MSVSVHYWAIPPKSRLYSRLQEDRTFNTLMAYLFPYGCGIYRLPEFDPEELEDLLVDVAARHRATLGPNPEARRRLSEFLAELEHTRAEFPGIERRTAMLEKCSEEVEEQLTAALQNACADPADRTRRIMFGDKQLAAHLREPHEQVLGLVSVPIVQEAAASLRQLEPERLFPSREPEHEWFWQSYAPWRQMYLEAAKHNEEIVIGVS